MSTLHDDDIRTITEGGRLDPQADAGRQVTQVEDCLSRNANAIVVDPIESSSLLGVLEEAGKRKIPVATLDTKVDSPHVVTLIGVRLSFAIGGSVVIETVFALPGLGSWMVESIFSRDYMVVQTLTLAFALGAMLINLATDLIYPLLDPRVRVG